MKEKQVHDEVIVGYRRLIYERYQYDALRTRYDIPDSFDAQRVARFRDYFLEYLYPPPEKRDALNDAFYSLDSYIQQPEKLLRMLVASSKLLFRYGRHLPKILRAGINALRAFRTGNQFEQKLVQKAISLDIQPPYTIDDVNRLIRALSREEIEAFIRQSQVLLETLYDRKLMYNIIDIVEYLIATMQKNPNVYTAQDIQGLELGRDLIKKGYTLFEELSVEEQKLIFQKIIEIERNALDRLF